MGAIKFVFLVMLFIALVCSADGRRGSRRRRLCRLRCRRVCFPYRNCRFRGCPVQRYCRIRCTNPCRFVKNIISRWKWRASFTFKVYSVWQKQRWRANKGRVYWCYWSDAGRWSRIVWNHWHQLWSEDNLRWIEAGHKRCSWWWAELWLIRPPFDRRTRHHSALSLTLWKYKSQRLCSACNSGLQRCTNLHSFYKSRM